MPTVNQNLDKGNPHYQCPAKLQSQPARGTEHGTTDAPCRPHRSRWRLLLCERTSYKERKWSSHEKRGLRFSLQTVLLSPFGESGHFCRTLAVHLPASSDYRFARRRLFA